MPLIENITAGTSPLLWSNVDQAFNKINANFTALAATIGSGNVIDFSNLVTDVSPNATNQYVLGTSLKSWRAVHTNEWSTVPGSEFNGLWAGNAHIKGIGTHIELPEGSTVNGNLIIDTDKTFFKAVQIDNGNRIVANDFSDTINLLSGTAIHLVTDSSSESITINNTGVTNIVSSTGISVSANTGSITIGNTGVTSLTAGNPVTGRVSGRGISVSNRTGAVSITNTGVLEVQQGFGITVSTDTVTGIVTVSNSAPAQVTFRTINITGTTGQIGVTADSTSDILTFNAGYGIIITTSEPTDTITFSLDKKIDINGSIFADDSTKIVDAVEGKFYGALFGPVTGSISSTNTSGVILNTAGTVATYKGNVLSNNTGSAILDTSASVATFKGNVLSNNTGSVIINTSGATATFTGTADVATTVTLVATDTTSATHYLTFVDTATGNENVRTDTNLTWNPGTNTLTALNIVTSTITSADSSAITFVAPVAFNADITAENDLIVRADIKDSNGHFIVNYPATNRFYVDPSRTDTYTPTGNLNKPFKTVTAAVDFVNGQIKNGLLTVGSTNPVFIVLKGNVSSETVTLTTGYVYLVGESAGFGSPVYFGGNIVIQPTSGTIDANHFGIKGIRVVSPSDSKAITCSGTTPCRVYLQDVWISASGTLGSGYYQSNSGTGTTVYGENIRLAHSGSGDIYCVEIVNGRGDFRHVKTFGGPKQAGVARQGATLAFYSSQLETTGDNIVESYNSGILILDGCYLANSFTDAHGIRLNGTDSTAIVTNCTFNVNAGTGKAVYSAVTINSPYGLFQGSNTFYSGSNTAKSASITKTDLATAFT
jgi:hypothetical protein